MSGTAVPLSAGGESVEWSGGLRADILASCEEKGALADFPLAECRVVILQSCREEREKKKLPASGEGGRDKKEGL